MTTGQKIYELRKNARITQEQFAEKLDVSRQAVSKWESDAAYPETDKIIKIAELFGVSCDYLLKSDAEQNDDVLSKRRRAFLTMLISFAVVSAVVGYVVAVICYYCIDMRESPLIGFGVLAAFLLAAFILWQVGRYRFLNECDYSEEDKTHLANMTRLYYYTSIIALFCYIPAFIFLYMSAYVFAFSFIAFGAVGCVTSYMVSLCHMRVLQRKVGAPAVCDAVIFAVAVIFAAAASIIVPRVEDVFSISISENNFGYILAVAFGTLLPAALFVNAILQKIFNRTPLPLFIFRLTTCIFCMLTIWYSITDLSVVTGIIAALYVASLITMVVLSRRYSRKNTVHAMPLRIELPVYVFTFVQLILITARVRSFVPAEVCLSLMAAVVAVLYCLPSAADKKQ